MNKKKFGFIGIFMALIATLIVAMTVPNNKVHALSSTEVEMTYEVYDEDTYLFFDDDACLEKYGGTPSDLSDSIDFYDAYLASDPADAEAYMDGSMIIGEGPTAADKANYALYQEGWWLEYRSPLGTAPSIKVKYVKKQSTKYVIVEVELKAGANLSPSDARDLVDIAKNPKPLSSTDSVEPGKKLYVQIYVETMGAFDSYQYGLDATGIKTVTGSISKTDLEANSSSNARDIGFDAPVLTWPNTETLCVGANGGSGAGAGKHLLGTIGFTTTKAGSLTISGNLNKGVSAISNGTSDYSIHDNPFSCTVGSTAKNTTTNLGAVSITPSSSLTTSTGTTTSGTTHTTDTVDASKGAITLNIAKSADNSTITKVSTVSTSASGASGSLTTVTSPSTSFIKSGIALSGFTTGASIYIAFEVTSEDGNNHEVHVVEIPLAASTANSLDAATIGVTGSTGSVASSATITSPAVSATPSVDIPNDATQITFSNVQFTGDHIAVQVTNGNIGGASSQTYNSSPATFNVTPTNHTSDVTVKITSYAQDGSTHTDYTYTIHQKSVSTTITGVDVYAYKGSTKGSSSTTTVVSGAYEMGTGFNYGDADGFGVQVNAASSEKIKSATISSTNCLNTCGFAQTFTTGVTGVTDTVTVTVTAEWGNTKTYTVKAKRAAADTACTLTSGPTLNYKAENVDKTPNNGTLAGTWNQTAGNPTTHTFVPTAGQSIYASSNVLEYDFKNVDFVGAIPAKAKAYYTTDGTTPTTSSTAFTGTANLAFSSTNAENKKLQVLVVAEDGVTKALYVLDLSREKADTDTTFSITAELADGTPITLNNVGGTYKNNTDKIPNASTAVKITVTPNKSTSFVYDGSGANITGTKTTFTLNTATYVTNVGLTIKAENGNAPISIELTREAPSSNANYDIWGAEDAAGAKDLGFTVANGTQNTVKVPYNATNVYLKFQTKDANTVIKQGSNIAGTNAAPTAYTSYPISFANSAATTTTINFTIYTEANPSGAALPITIERVAADDTKTFTVTGTYEDATGAYQSIGTFTVTGTTAKNDVKVPYGTKKVKLTFSSLAATTTIKDGTKLVGDSTGSIVDQLFTFTPSSSNTGTISLQMYTQQSGSTSYPVTITIENTPADDSKFYTVDAYYIDPSNGTTQVPVTFNVNTSTYKAENSSDPIPYGITTIYFIFTTPKPTTTIETAAGTKIGDSTFTPATTHIAVTLTPSPSQTKETLNYTVKTEKNPSGSPISVEVYNNVPDNDTSFTVNAYYLDPSDGTTPVPVTFPASGASRTNAVAIPYGVTDIYLSFTTKKTTTVIKDSTNTVVGAKTAPTAVAYPTSAAINFKLYTEADPTTGTGVTITPNMATADDTKTTTVTGYYLDGSTKKPVTFVVTGTKASNIGDKVPYGTTDIYLLVKPTVGTTKVDDGNGTIFTSTSTTEAAYSLVVNPSSTFTTVSMNLTTQKDTTGVTYTVDVYNDVPSSNTDVTITATYTDASGATKTVTFTKASANTYKPTAKLPFKWQTVTYTVKGNDSNTYVYDGTTNINDVAGQVINNGWTAANQQNTTKKTLDVYTQSNPYGVAGSSPFAITLEIEQETPCSIAQLDVSAIIVKGDADKITYSTSDTTSPFNYTIPKAGTNNGFYNIFATITAKSVNAKIYYSYDINKLQEQGELTSTDKHAIGAFGTPTTTYVTVYAEDESTHTTYQFVVQDVSNKKNNNLITDIEFLEKDGVTPVTPKLLDGSNYKYTQDANNPQVISVIFPYSVKDIVVKVSKDDPSATLSSASSIVGGVIDITGADETTYELLTYQLVAENGTAGQKTTIKIYREAPSNDQSLTLKINNTPVVFTGTKADLVFPHSTASVTFDVKVAATSKSKVDSSEGSYSMSSTKSGTLYLVAGGKITLDVYVQSEDDVSKSATGKKYTVTIYAADQAFDVTDIKLYNNASGAEVNGKTGTATTAGNFAFSLADKSPTIQKFTFAYGEAETVRIEALVNPTTSSNADISYKFGASTGDIQTINSGTSGGTFYVTVKSEYAALNPSITNQQVTYAINVVREKASDVAQLKFLSIEVGGKTYGGWAVDDSNYVVSVDGTFNGTNTSFDRTVLGPYSVENVAESATTVTIKAILADNCASLATLSFSAGTPTFTGAEGKTVASIDLTAFAQKSFAVTVTPEAGSAYAKNYTITVARSTVKLDDNHVVTDIEIVDTADASTNLISFSKATTTDTFNIRGTTSNLKVSVTTEVTTSIVTIKANGETTGVTGKTRVIPVTPGSNITIEVECAAEDGSGSSTYTYTCTVPPLDDDNTLKTFTVDGVDVLPNVTSSTDYTVPFSTSSIGTIYAEATSTTAKLSKYATSIPALKVGRNYVNVTVTPEDSSKAETYTLCIIRDEELKLDATDGLSAKTDVSGTMTEQIAYDGTVGPFFFQVPYSTDKMEVSYKLPSTVSASNVKVTGTGTITLLPGKNDYYVEVESLLVPGNKTTYTITVERKAASTDNYILYFHDEGPSGTVYADEGVIDSNGDLVSDGFSTKNNYTYVVGNEYVYFNPTMIISDGATIKSITPTNKNVVKGANVFEITVTSEGGKDNKYTIKVVKGEGNAEITNIEVLDKAAGNNVKDLVTDAEITFANGTPTYKLTVPYSTKQVFLQVTTKESSSKVNVNTALFTNSIVSLAQGKNTFTIQAESEVAQYFLGTADYNNYLSSPYTVEITREAPNSDATLKSLVIDYVDDDGNNKQIVASTADLTAQLLTIENIGNVSSVTVTAIATYKATTISGLGGTTNANDEYIATKGLSPIVLNSDNTVKSGYNFSLTVTTLAEDGTTTLDYEIAISRGPINLQSDATLEYIKVDDSTSKIWLDEKATQSDTEVFNSTKTSYSYTIPYGAQTVTIYGHKLAAAKSKVYIYEQGTTALLAATGSKAIAVTAAMYGTTVKYEVYVESEDTTTKSTVYTVELKFEAPSVDATLKTLTADGATVTGFQPTDVNGTYTLTSRANNITSIIIAATTTDANAKAIICNGVAGTAGSFSKTFSLAEGTNQFIITVTAQDGTTQNTYIVNVDREYPLPYLTDLGVIGEALLSATTDKGVKFDQTRDPNTGVANTLEYHVKVTYITTTGVITASVDNPTFTVTCTNSTILTTGLTNTWSVNFVEGDNPFQIEVRSKDGKTQTYKLIIKRATAAETSTDIDTATIKQVPQFDKDFISTSSHGTKGDGVFGIDNNGAALSDYRVNNNVTKLDVDFRAAQAGATVKVYNDKDLKPGNNEVLVVVTAEDGVTSRVLVVNVYREEMEFEVNKDATTFETVKVDDSTYTIKLGKLRANALTEQDYKDYITWDSKTNDLTVEVLSDINDEDCSEVLLAITDGDEIKYVKLQLDSETIGNTSFFNSSNFKDWFPWALLIIAGILLVIILICVNRDKYGAINKKRKDQE